MQQVSTPTISPVPVKTQMSNGMTVSTQYDTAQIIASRPIDVPQMGLTFASQAEQASANVYQLPRSITVVVASATGVGGVNTRVYLFNQSRMNNVTDNGSGANSITYTYQDGFSGNVISDILSQARSGVGAVCTRVAVRMNITSSGAGDPAGLASTNPAFRTYNAFGDYIPNNFNITSGQGRGDFDDSIEVQDCVTNITKFTQYSFVIPVGDTATLTFYFPQA